MLVIFIGAGAFFYDYYCFIARAFFLQVQRLEKRNKRKKWKIKKWGKKNSWETALCNKLSLLCAPRLSIVAYFIFFSLVLVRVFTLPGEKSWSRAGGLAVPRRRGARRHLDSWPMWTPRRTERDNTKAAVLTGGPRAHSALLCPSSPFLFEISFFFFCRPLELTCVLCVCCRLARWLISGALSTRRSLFCRDVVGLSTVYILTLIDFSAVFWLSSFFFRMSWAQFDVWNSCQN